MYLFTRRKAEKEPRRLKGGIANSSLSIGVEPSLERAVVGWVLIMAINYIVVVVVILYTKLLTA